MFGVLTADTHTAGPSGLRYRLLRQAGRLQTVGARTPLTSSCCSRPLPWRLWGPVTACVCKRRWCTAQTLTGILCLVSQQGRDLAVGLNDLLVAIVGSKLDTAKLGGYSGCWCISNNVIDLGYLGPAGAVTSSAPPVRHRHQPDRVPSYAASPVPDVSPSPTRSRKPASSPRSGCRPSASSTGTYEPSGLAVVANIPPVDSESWSARRQVHRSRPVKFSFGRLCARLKGTPGARTSLAIAPTASSPASPPDSAVDENRTDLPRDIA